MTEQNKYVFDPIIGANDRLCGECTHKIPGTLTTGFGHVIEMLWCWLFRHPFSTVTCRVFYERLQVFQDGDACKTKRCPQCRMAPSFLVPIEYLELPEALIPLLTDEAEPAFVPEARVARSATSTGTDGLEEHLIERGKGHLIEALGPPRGNVRQLQRRPR
jgi:hypothetical protein